MEAARQQTAWDWLRLEAARRDAETGTLVRESANVLRKYQRSALVITRVRIATGLPATAALLRVPGVRWVSLLAGGWVSVVARTGLLGKV